MAKKLKSISIDRDQILMDHGFDPNDQSYQVQVSLSKIEHNPDGREDYTIGSDEVETSEGVDFDLNIEIYRV